MNIPTQTYKKLWIVYFIQENFDSHSKNKTRETILLVTEDEERAKCCWRIARQDGLEAYVQWVHLEKDGTEFWRKMRSEK